MGNTTLTRYLPVVSSLLLLSLASCSTTVLPTSATLEGRTYKNHFFNFEVQIPQGWTIGNKNDFDQGLLAENPDEKSSRKILKEENKIWYLLLLASETPVGTPAKSNPAIILGVVDLSGEPSMRNAKDYESIIAQSLVEKQRTWEQINDPFPVKLQSKEFYRVDFQINGPGPTMYEAYFMTIKKNYTLILTITADSTADVNKILAQACAAKNGVSP